MKSIPSLLTPHFLTLLPPHPLTSPASVSTQNSKLKTLFHTPHPTPHTL
ncbi:hypothetical protein K9N68_10565 [Kovacikia minuta CCNUW1]|nr:hypothetical protein [Kovacikia minuta]UBF28276.1 hypothetical protein K9N68_10565 [Kovacikia minuta CCNUW1]